MNKRYYKGVEIHELATSQVPVEATVAYGNKRLVFRGLCTVDKTQGSWKFGEQIQLVLWTKEKVKVENRAENNGYNRIEIALPKEIGIRMIQEVAEGIKQAVHIQNNG